MNTPERRDAIVALPVAEFVRLIEAPAGWTLKSVRHDLYTDHVEILFSSPDLSPLHEGMFPPVVHSRVVPKLEIEVLWIDR